MNQTAFPDSVVLHADQEHGGIQFAVPLIMLGAGVVTFLFVDSLLLAPLLEGGSLNDYRMALRIVLSIVLGIAIGGVAETILKRVWVSGRQLCLEPDGLIFGDKDQQAQRIAWDKRVNVSRWHYSLRGFPRGGRERRVPADHHMCACRLLQDNLSLVVYSYLLPRRARTIPGFAKFTELNIAELYSSSFFKRYTMPERPRIHPSLLTGKHGQLWVAEKERWTASFELTPDDFMTLLDALERHVGSPET